MSISRPKNIPSASGVYIFRKGKRPIYIGKAANLKKRLSSYFRKNTSSKIKQLLQEATSLDWIETSSEIGAFLQEAELIKKHRPKYNVVLRDDKNYFYVGFTKEKFPKVFVSHQLSKNEKANYIGPFTSGAALKIVLKLLRRVFPYCTCKKPHKRICLNAQIGRCSGYCCLDVGEKQTEDKVLEYNKNIKSIIAVLGGRKKKLIRFLKKEMKTAAKNQDFERAAKLRNQLSGLENIFSHRFFLADYRGKTSIVPWMKIEREIGVLTGDKKSVSRVEGYDISNISGQEATGSMVVFIDGKPAKDEYRKFKIKKVRGISDVAMLKEIVGRRLNHPEWFWPGLMLIDGGRAQLDAVLEELRIKNYELRIRAVALAKREEELYLGNRKLPIRLSSLSQATAFFLQRVRDESHRFARVYHHKLRKRHFHEK